MSLAGFREGPLGLSGTRPHSTGAGISKYGRGLYSYQDYGRPIYAWGLK